MPKIFNIKDYRSSKDSRLNDLKGAMSDILSKQPPKPKEPRYRLYIAIFMVLTVLLLLTLNIYAHNIYTAMRNADIVVISGKDSLTNP
jgi:hypothetical protein